jgi:hypothetical protein
MNFIYKALISVGMYAIISIQYTFITPPMNNQNTFDDLVYMEISIPNGRLSNGVKTRTSISIGMKYLIDW